MTRRRLLAGLRFAGVVFFLWLFARDVAWAQVGEALLGRRAAGWLFAASVLYAVGQVANGLAWRVLLQSTGAEISLADVVRHDLSSVFWSTVVPGGVAGELVKGVRLARGGMDTGTVTVAIAGARLISGTVSCLLALALLPFGHLAPVVRAFAAVTLVATALVGLFGLAVLRLGPAAFQRALPRLAARVPVGAFPPPRALLACFAASLATHVAFAAVHALGFGAAGQPLGLADGAALSALTSVVQVVPISVGGLGLRELTLSGLAATVVATHVADGGAIVLSGMFTVVAALGGAVELARSRR